MVNNHYRWDFIGLSTEEKPTPETSEKVVDGSTFYCSDNSKLYVFCQGTWYEKVVEGGGGGGGATGEAKVLTSADYNANSSNWSDTNPTNFNCVALWKLDPGMYCGNTSSGGINVYISSTRQETNFHNIWFVGYPNSSNVQILRLTNNSLREYLVGVINGNESSMRTFISTDNITQTTGTSTTDVMSQNATTSMVFADPSTKKRVQIGNNATADTECVAIGENAGTTGQNQIAIGRGARVQTANARGCIALGDQTVNNSTVNGVMSIGPLTTSYGYNNTNYRLLTGVYDGQSVHDAVTVGQINDTIDAINTALSTNIPHIGASS